MATLQGDYFGDYTIGSDDYYSSVLRAWKFEPKLKMHTSDFQIAAFKPSNWQGKLRSATIVSNSFCRWCSVVKQCSEQTRTQSSSVMTRQSLAPGRRADGLLDTIHRHCGT